MKVAVSFHVSILLFRITARKKMPCLSGCEDRTVFCVCSEDGMTASGGGGGSDSGRALSHYTSPASLSGSRKNCGLLMASQSTPPTKHHNGAA